ncbi:MAG: hypothetical protein HC836_47765 [Richelia sp. RM2_1_2]|nr:hypothetical protein [Richelia sp. RM2_1_2]
MKIRFNALYARFEIKQEIDTSPAVPPIALNVWEELPFNCAPTDAIGDFVYIDPINADTVIKNTDNTPNQPTIGIIIAKPTTTTCRVALNAEITGFSGLTQGQQVFLSTGGGLTSVPPATAYVQMLGYALSPTRIKLEPYILRARRAS